MDFERTRLRTGIFLALLTPLLTPLLSGTVVYFQLSQERTARDFYETQAKQEQRITRKLDLETKVQKLVGEILNFTSADRVPALYLRALNRSEPRCPRPQLTARVADYARP